MNAAQRLTPIDPEGLGRLWAEVGLPDEVADAWARDGLDSRSAQRVMRAYYDEEISRILSTAGL